MIYGNDYLAGVLYKKEILQVHKPEYAAGLFAETFGDAFKVAEDLLKSGKVRILRLNLIWSDTHSFGDRDIPKIKTLAAKYNKLKVKYPNADIRLSPFCEHNILRPDKYLDICQSYAPDCVIVNTPWKGGISSKYINEVHGNAKVPAGRYMYSFDGTEATNSDVENIKKKHKNAEVFFMWTNRFNLNWSEKDKTPRAKRIKEAKDRAPSKDMINSITYLFGDKGTYNLDSKTLLKSHSEKHNKDDRKGDKLLIITPTKAKELILKRNGRIIGKLPYYEKYEDGRHRYYAPKMGYTYGANVDVYVGSKHLGKVNCGFRSKPFR